MCHYQWKPAIQIIIIVIIIIIIIFLHARPWIPGGEIAIFTAVIH